MTGNLRLAFLVAAAALVACGQQPSDDGLVARAGDHTWSVESAAALLAQQPDLPAEREVVRALAELWIDYTLLAAAAEQDTPWLKWTCRPWSGAWQTTS